MQIHFAIQARDGTALNEEQALSALAAGTTPTAETYLFGWLRWRHEGQPDLDFNDDLAMLLPNLPGVVAAVRAQGQAQLNMVSYFCHLTLMAEDGTVQVLQEDSEMSGQEVARYPKEALLEALVACAHRFATYLQALAELDPRWTGVRDAMAELSAKS